MQQSLYTGCITAIVRRLERLVAVYRARYTLRAAGSHVSPCKFLALSFGHIEPRNDRAVKARKATLPRELRSTLLPVLKASE